jgi:hypothetical protein
MLHALLALSSFWVWDLRVMPPAFRKPEFRLAATAPAGADHLNVWVENGLGERDPSPRAIEHLTRAFADESKGALAIERRAFGPQPTPPSKDRDVHLVIASLPPFEKNGKKFGFDGYFNAFDQLTEADAAAQGQHSNERDIIYVNALQDLDSDYMRGVIAHELAHLITHGPERESWFNEMLGEAAMQMTGYFTDLRHVDSYRAHPEWPLAVTGYGVSYGGVSLLAEYLLARFGDERFGRLATAPGGTFAKFENVYGMRWSNLFEGYARWLFEQKPPSRFVGTRVPTRKLAGPFKLPPSGVVYLEAGGGAPVLEITAVPQSCASSRSVIRLAPVTRQSFVDENAYAAWVESEPPCAANQGGAKSESDAFVITPR